jgi:hypothetical protein
LTVVNLSCFCFTAVPPSTSPTIPYNTQIDKFLGTVAVDYNDPADVNQIQDCIEETGFKIV